MVTVVKRTDQSEGAFRGLGDVIHDTSERHRVSGETAADEKALRNAIHKLGDNASPRQILDAITGTKTYSPQSKQNLLKNYLGVSEFEELQKKAKTTQEANKLKTEQQNLEKEAKTAQEKGSSIALIDNSSLPEDQKTQLKQGIESGLVSYDAVKQLTKPKKEAPKSEFHKGLAKENVKQYVKSENDVVAADRTLKDLDRLDELNKELSGPLGYFNALDPFNEKAAELTSLGFGVLEAPVHIFNPSGPIAQKKLEQLQKIYGINRFDSSATVNGKISALRRYAKDLQSVAQQRLDLFEKYDGNPPLGEIARLDARGNEILNVMEKTPIPGVPIEPPKGAPEANKFKGKSIKFPDGNIYYSDGEVWRAK